jgi:hypothetical protein
MKPENSNKQALLNNIERNLLDYSYQVNNNFKIDDAVFILKLLNKVIVE